LHSRSDLSTGGIDSVPLAIAVSRLHIVRDPVLAWVELVAALLLGAAVRYLDATI